MWMRYRLPCALGLLVLLQFTIGRSLQFPDSISDKRNSPEENKDVYDRGIESAIRDENPPPRRPPGCCTPELHLGFDDATDDLVVDSHDVHRAQSRAVSTVDAPCSNYADLNVDVVQFESAKFAKVTDAITITIWVNLKTISGIRPILLIKGLTGELRFEIAQGHVTWLYFARRPLLATFALLSPKPVVATETWTHLVAQYDAHSNRAAVFVNGEEILQSKSNGESVEIPWSEFTTIGKYSINEELEFKLTGHIDEFYIYYCALPEMVIQKLYKMCHTDGKCAPRKPDDGELCDVSAFHCKNGKCIRQAWRCDSENDCGDWSDEIGCDGICGPDEQPSSSQRQCVSCFCMGRSQNCRSANFYRDKLKMQLTNEKSPPVIHLVDVNGSDVSNITYTVDQLNNGVVAHNASKGTEYYWTLPKEFLGNKLSSYGGKLRYTVNYIAGTGLTDRYAKNAPRHIRSLQEIINGKGFVASYAIYDVHDEEPTDSGGSGIEDPSMGDSGQVTSTPKTQSTDSQVTKMTTNLQETTSEPDKDTEMVIDQDDRHTNTHGAKPDSPTPAATPNGTSILTKSETTPLLILKTHPSERLPSTADLPTSETLALSSTGTDAFIDGEDGTITFVPPPASTTERPTSETVSTIPDTSFTATDVSIDVQDEKTTFQPSSAYNSYSPTSEEATTRPDTSSTKPDETINGQDETTPAYTTDSLTLKTLTTLPETFLPKTDTSTKDQGETGQDEMSTAIPFSAYRTEKPAPDTVTIIPDMFYTTTDAATEGQGESATNEPSSPYSSDAPTSESVTTIPDTLYAKTDAPTDDQDEATTFVSSVYSTERPTLEKVTTKPDTPHTVTSSSTDDLEEKNTTERPSAYNTDVPTSETIATIPETSHTTADGSYDAQHDTTLVPSSAYSTERPTSDTSYMSSPTNDQSETTISVPSSPYSTNRPTPETVTTMQDTVYTTTDTLTDGLHETTIKTTPDALHTTRDMTDGQDYITTNEPPSAYKTDKQTFSTVTTIPSTLQTTADASTDGQGESTTAEPPSAYSTDSRTSELLTTIPGTFYVTDPSTDSENDATISVPSSPYSTDKPTSETVTTIPDTVYTTTDTDGLDDKITTAPFSTYSTDAPTSETVTTIPDVVYTTIDTPTDGQDETTISVPSSPYSTDRPTPETVTTMPDTVYRTTETPTDGQDETTTTAPSSAYSTDGSTSETVTTIPDTLHTATDTTDGQDYITTTDLPSVYRTDKQIFSTVTTIPSTLQTPTAALTADGQDESTTTEPPSAYSTDSPTSETLTTIPGTFHATDSSTDSDNEATTTAPSSTYRTDKPTSQRVTTLPETLHTTMDTSTDGQEETTTFVSSAYSTKKPVSDAVTTIPDASTDGLDETTTTEPSLAYSTEEPTSDTVTAILGTLYTTEDTSTDGQDEMTSAVLSSAYSTAKPTSDTVTTILDTSHSVTSVSTDDQDKTTTTEPPLSYSTKRPISERVTATATLSSTTSREGTTSEATTPTSEPAIKCRVGHEFYPVNSVFVTKSCTSRCSCLKDGSLRCAPLCIEDVPLCEDNEKEVESRKPVENISCVCVEKRCVRVDDATKTTPSVTQTTVAPTPTPGQVTDAVQLVGKDGTLVFYPEVQPSTGKYQTTMEVSLTEAKWRSSNGAPTSRDTFMRVLSDIQAIYVKAQYGDDESRAVSLSIKEISLDISSQHNKGFGNTLLVEQCECPVGYSGLSCEYCSPGYTRSSDGLGCMKCLCNEHSDVCDQENGTCLGCRHNTEGLHCDRCQAGYFGNALKGTPTDCQPCPCPLTLPPNQFSSTCFLGKDGLPTCDACPVGYTGRNCELCAVNFTGNPMIHHSKCKLAVSELKECDSHGSLDIKPDNRTQKCLCKANVHGVSCDTCKPRFFNLRADNPQGCTPCFCNGVTDSCQSAMLNRTQIRSTFSVNELMNFTLVRLDQTPVNSSDLFVNPLTKELTFQSFVAEGLQGTILYWKLPQEYTGNKVTSYGGILNHVISFVASSDGELISAPDIVLVGKYSSIYHFKETFAQSNEETAYGVKFNEHFWSDGNGGVISRDQLIMALHQVEALLIRASYNTRMLQTTLREVSMDIATNDITNHSRVTSVEQCACPLEYQGLSCESCKPGFYWSRVGPYLGTCVKCKCHGHARDNYCDPETGECKNCQHNTAGFHCEKCLTGFYGNATIGKPSECKPCPCPMTSPPNRFSPTCFMAEDGQPTCDACPPGYGGRRCDRCIPPYIGNPTEPGGNCKLELDCGCDVRGSVNSSCDPVTRQCFCKKACPGCIGIVFRYQNV